MSTVDAPSPERGSAGLSSLSAPALLTLSAKGEVLHASPGAGLLWHTDPGRLVGMMFPQLFALEIVSDDPLFIEAQWEVIAASASEQPIALAARPLAAEPIETRVRLEAATGGAAAHFATVCVAPKASPVPDAGEPSATAPRQAALDLLAASAAVGFFDLHFAEGAVRYSSTWKRQLGYREADLEDTYDTWLRLLHPDDSAAAPDRVGRRPSSADTRTFSVEFRMKHRRGHWVWLQCTGVQRFTSAGELERVVGLHLDITERKELEEQTLLADDRLFRLATEGRLGIFDLDFATGGAGTSPAWLVLTGDHEEAPTLDQIARRFGATDADGLAALFRKTPADQPWTFQAATLHDGDGKPIPVLLGAHRQVSRRGELLRVVGFALPADARRPSGTEAGLTQAALATLHEAVILADPSGRIVHLNAKAERLTGCPAATATARGLPKVFRLVTVEGGRSADDALDLALGSDEPERIETGHALVTDHGPPRPIAWTAAQVRDPDGRPLGVVVTFRDPSEMSLTPEELIRANRFDSLGQLAGGIAHDFNNLLTAILGGISQAKDNRDYSILDDAETACLAAKALTRQLLGFAKGSAGGALQVVHPAEIMRDAVRVAAAGAVAKISLELDESAGPVEVDRGQILQVFQNLIINALQALPEPSAGTLWLRCSAVELSEQELPPLPAGPYVRMDVQDNGSGIDPANLERIFQPFFTTKKTGTGLGLATVVSILRKHGGQLGVESAVGSGTTFSAFLPVTDRPVESRVRRAPGLSQGTGRILLMDDDPKITEITGGMLSSLDYAFDAAKNGQEAIKLYQRYLNIGRPYDAIILDLTIIGGMGGEECFKQLRKLDPNVRAIVSSGYDNDEMARAYLDMGFCGYLTKPYRVTDVARILKSVLGKG